MTPDDLIHPSSRDDLPAIVAVYGWNVEHGTGPFELEAPQGLPWPVLERAGSGEGYSHATRFRSRPAYRFCLEDPVYLAPAATGQGSVRLLLLELLSRCEAAIARRILAVVGDSANADSVGVHRSLGFLPVGTIAAAGWKFGRWLDVVMMQKSLSTGAGVPASA